MDQSNDTQARIFKAADALYEQAGRGAAFPTVDAVRKAARVNMNDAATAMKEWRRAQTAQAAPVAITVPDSVQQLHSQALAALWQAAQASANESLRGAQAGWEAERAEADTLNKQLGDAYDAQAGELETATRQLAEQAAALQVEQERTAELSREVEDLRTSKLAAESRAVLAEQRAIEVERRADDLRAELDHAHQDAERLRTELAAAAAATVEAARRTDDLRAELATVKAKAEAADHVHQDQRQQAAAETHRTLERLSVTQAAYDEARREAATAREEAARLYGQLQAHQEQTAAILARLTPATEAKPANKTAKKSGGGSGKAEHP